MYREQSTDWTDKESVRVFEGGREGEDISFFSKRTRPSLVPASLLQDGHLGSLHGDKAA